MVKTNKFRTFEEGILLIQQAAKAGPLSIAQIFRILSGKEQILIAILLSLPFCLPIQIPGLSTPFGLLIAFLGLRIAFVKRIWLPKKLLAKTITPQTLKKITKKTLSLSKKIKPLIRPRLSKLLRLPFMKIMNGSLIFILGILLALPLPVPFTNLTVGWSIFLIALSMIEDDGVVLLIGYFATLIAVIYFIGIFLIAGQIFGIGSWS